MQSHSQAKDAKLDNYLQFLRTSGFPDAAAKLEREFTPVPEAEARGVSPQAPQPEASSGKGQDRSSQLDRLRHCSTSSLESCGAVSGPIASSCPSQFASPSHAVSAGRHDHGGRVSSSVPVASSSANPRQVSTVANAISTSEADQGFTRVPVSNQVWFEANELISVAGEPASRNRGATRRSPQQALPHGYFHGARRDEGSVPTAAFQGQTSSLQTQLPPALVRLASQCSTHGPSPPQDHPARRSLSESHNSFSIRQSDADPLGQPSPRPSSAVPASVSPDAPSFSTPAIPKSPSAGRMCSVAHSAGGGPVTAAAGGGLAAIAASHRRSLGHHCSASVSTLSAADGVVASSLSVGSGAGLRQGAWLGSHDSLRRSTAADDSPLFGDVLADVNDPPDAPEDAAVFMHDISHSAWHHFTRHVAKEAASISGSSLYTAQAVDPHAAEASSMQPGTPHTVHSMPSRAPSWTAERPPESPSYYARLTHSSGGGFAGPSSPPSMHSLSTPFHHAYAPHVPPGHAQLLPPASAPAVMAMPPHCPTSPQPPLHAPDALRWPPSPGRLSPSSSSAAAVGHPPPHVDRAAAAADDAAPALFAAAVAAAAAAASGPPGLPPPLLLPGIPLRSSRDGSGEPQGYGSAECATADMGSTSSRGSCAESVSVAGHSHDSSGSCSILVRDAGSLDPSPGAEEIGLSEEFELPQQPSPQPALHSGDAAESAPAPPAPRALAARQLSSSTKASSIRREASLCMDPGMAQLMVAVEHGSSRGASPAPDVDNAEGDTPASDVLRPGEPEHSTFTAWRSVSAPLQEARTPLIGDLSRGWEAAAALHALESAPSAAAGSAEFSGLDTGRDSPAVSSEQLLQPLLLGATVQPVRVSLEQLSGEALATSPVLAAASPFHYSAPGPGAQSSSPVAMPPSRTQAAAVVLGNLGDPHAQLQSQGPMFSAAPGSPTAAVLIHARDSAAAEAAELAGLEASQPTQDNMCSVGSLIALPDAGSMAAERDKEYHRAPSFGIDIVRQGSSAQSAVPEEAEEWQEEEGNFDVTLDAEELPHSNSRAERVLVGEERARQSMDSVRSDGSTVAGANPPPADSAALATAPSAATTSLAGTLTFASDGRTSHEPSSPHAHSSPGHRRPSGTAAAMPPPRSGGYGDGDGFSGAAMARASSAGHEADDEAGSECGSIGSAEIPVVRPLGVLMGRGLATRPEYTHMRAHSALVGTEPSPPWVKSTPAMHKSLTLRGDSSSLLPQPDLDLGAQSLMPAAADSPPMPLFAGSTGGGSGPVPGVPGFISRDSAGAPHARAASTAVTTADTNVRAASSNGFFTWDSSHLSRRESSDSLASPVSVSSGMPTSPMPDCSSPLDPLTVPDVLMHTVGSVFDSPQQATRSSGAPHDSEPSAFDLTEYEADSDADAGADTSVCLFDLSPAATATAGRRGSATGSGPAGLSGDLSPTSPPDSPSATLMTLTRPVTAPASSPGITPLTVTLHSSGELNELPRPSSDLGSARSSELAAPDLGAALISPRRGPAWSAPAPIPSTHGVLGPIPPSPPLPPATSDKGFLLLDDKFPESEYSASPVAAESSCATAAPDFRLHPFATTPASLATSVADADSSTLWAPAEPSDSAPLRQATAPENLTTRYSSGVGSAALAPSEPSDTHARPDSISILEPVEPMLSQRSSSANAASPAGVGTWAARPPAPQPTPATPPGRPALQPIITTAPVAAASPAGPLSPSTPLDAYHSSTPTTSGGAFAWARYFLDAPASRMSSLQSSPAFSHRAMSTHRSPSGLPVTPSGSTSSVRAAAAAAASAPPSMSAAVQAAASASASASAAANEPPDYDPSDTPMVLWLPVYHRAQRTGLEAQKEFPIAIGDVIAQRYRVTLPLGSAAFSRAVAAVDVHTGDHVCLKVIRSNKDFFDQSLDEIKLLQMVNQADPDDTKGIVRLRNFFYWREHLVLATELLHLNLYQCARRATSAADRYFTLDRIREISVQVLRSLAFLHALGLIHCDLKPENIMVAEFERPAVKIIDLGSSCFRHDRLATYVQSRSYRAPEVLIKAPYGPKIDIWSLGAILAELVTGSVLFPNVSVATMLAKIESVCGPLSDDIVAAGRNSHLLYTRSRQIYERDPGTGALSVLKPVRSRMAAQLPPSAATDAAFVDFLEQLLQTDPALRPSAEAALAHPWLRGAASLTGGDPA